ncbi:hypothetical protein [Flavobacterium sp. N1994]|uniref:hypothetical protein n=1 Tax=Flavobacterium sp. N1994 TaxID=2986827 RepID=UPI0022235C3F|nr:hypothetical protein [Flavobacterium sp. N1994]
MKTITCRLEYHKYGTSALDTFSNEVKNGIFNNPTVFVAPPVTEADITAQQNAFNNAAAEYVQYGITKKVVYVQAKAILMYTLDKLATYVDSVAVGNVSVIALGGFVPTSDTPQSTEPLPKIEAFGVSLSKSSGEILIDIPAYANQLNVNYNCICVEDAPLQAPALYNGQIVLHATDPMVRQDFNKSRKKVFAGLTPGKKYYFYVFGANTAGVSPLSNPQSIWAS